MTVQELINYLNSVDDKDKKVYLSIEEYDDSFMPELTCVIQPVNQPEQDGVYLSNYIHRSGYAHINGVRNYIEGGIHPMTVKIIE